MGAAELMPCEDLWQLAKGVVAANRLYATVDEQAEGAVAALQAALGLEPDALNQTLRIHRPHLPDWLSSVTIHGLREPKATVDVGYRREEGTTLVAVLGSTGNLEVVVQY